MRASLHVTYRLFVGLAYFVAAVAVLTPQTMAQTTDSGAREVPARTVPVPTTVSPQMQKIIGAPLRPNWNNPPKTAEQWKPIADATAAGAMQTIPGMRERLHVGIEPATIDGVRAYVVTPDIIPAENRNRLLIHVHGGCYVVFPREAGLPEAILMAGFGHYKVISVDQSTIVCRPRHLSQLHSMMV